MAPTSSALLRPAADRFTARVILSGSVGVESPRQLGRVAEQPREVARRVVIADDHTVVREGLRLLLETTPAIEVVAEAADGHAVVAACRKYQPDIVVMELQLPSLDGIDAIRTIRRCCPDTQILVLSANSNESRAGDALNAGAHGYVLKQSGLENLFDALDALRTGGSYVDKALDRAQISTMRENSADKGSAPAGVALTRRQLQVLKLIAEGCKNRDIAERLTISQKTVETHRLNMMQKLDAHNVAELVKWAYRLDVISM